MARLWWGVRDAQTGGTSRAIDLATAQHCVNRDPARCELMMDVGYGWVAVHETFMMQLYGLKPLPPSQPRRLNWRDRVGLWVAVESLGVSWATRGACLGLCVGMAVASVRVLRLGRPLFQRNNG